MKFSLYSYGVFLFVGIYTLFIEGMSDGIITLLQWFTLIMVLKWLVSYYRDSPTFNFWVKHLF